MNLFLNADGTLQIDDKKLSAKIPLIWVKYDTKVFDILDSQGYTVLPGGVQNMDVFKVLDSSGNAYTDADAVYTAIANFFFNVAGSSVGFKIYQITVINGQQTYTLPSDFDETKPYIAFNPAPVTTTINTVAGVTSITFIDTLVVGTDFPFVLYNPK